MLRWRTCTKYFRSQKGGRLSLPPSAPPGYPGLYRISNDCSSEQLGQGGVFPPKIATFHNSNKATKARNPIYCLTCRQLRSRKSSLALCWRPIRWPQTPVPASCRAELRGAVEFSLRIMAHSAASAACCIHINLCGKTRRVNCTFAASNRTSDTLADNVTYVTLGRELAPARPRCACGTPPSTPAASVR
jgi:hypothetical protein